MALELSYFALFLIFTGCLAAGVVAAVVSTWSLRARLYSVENELTIVSARLLSEVRARAGQERWKKPDKDAELVQSLMANPQPVKKKNWWETVPSNRP